MFYCELLLPQTILVLPVLQSSIRKDCDSLLWWLLSGKSLASLLVSLHHCDRVPKKTRCFRDISSCLCPPLQYNIEAQQSKASCLHPSFRDRAWERCQGKDTPQSHTQWATLSNQASPSVCSNSLLT